MYAASFSPSPRIAAVNVVMIVFELPPKNSWPNGTPNAIRDTAAAIEFQNEQLDQTGVPRKTQM